MTFEAYNEFDILLGALTVEDVGDSSNNGETAEDTFFGIEDAGGIGRIFIRSVAISGGIEVDHLQYGGGVSAIPLPPAVWLFGTAIAGLIGFRRRSAVA